MLYSYTARLNSWHKPLESTNTQQYVICILIITLFLANKYISNVAVTIMERLWRFDRNLSGIVVCFLVHKTTYLSLCNKRSGQTRVDLPVIKRRNMIIMMLLRKRVTSLGQDCNGFQYKSV